MTAASRDGLHERGEVLNPPPSALGRKSLSWRKLGRIFAPIGAAPWMNSHAALPIADHIENGFFKVYFTARDKQKRSHTAYFVFDIANPHQILEVASVPVLEPGPLGAFDDSGAMATGILRLDSVRYMYYAGWNLGITVPYRNSVGLAISTDNGKTFSRYAPGPILDRTPHEPYFTGTTCVVRDKGIFKGWYQSCTRWEQTDAGPRHYYHIKYAESQDGINWIREGQAAIDFQNDGEHAICCPRVICEDGIYKMWYCYRGQTYRIGYAESKDGKSWTRRDESVAIDVSESGWDSEMICYPEIFDHAGQRYMLYNGNGYGSTGIGLAVLEHHER